MAMSQVQTFASLVDAARATFPTQQCRIISTREHGAYGFALFDTGPAGQPYLYGVNYERVDGRWREGSSSNGNGWSHLGPDPNRGTLSVWDIAPVGADRVRVELGEEIREEPIENGVYLVVWWAVPMTLGLWRTSFRINGQWT
jgi:hypothetical protein